MGVEKNRPLPVTIISAVFLLAGLVGFAYHATEFKPGGPFPYELIWVEGVRLLAVVAAVFALRGAGWARWLLVAWIAYHVVLSFFHTPVELLVHAALLVVVVYFLFRPDVSQYFRGSQAASRAVAKTN